MGPGKSYLRIAKKMATNPKNGVFGGMAARGGRGGGCRGARGPISRGFGTSPHSFPQPTITRKAQTNRRGGTRPTTIRYGRVLDANGIFAFSRVRGPFGARLAAAARPRCGRKTAAKRARCAGPQRRPTPGRAAIPRRCGVGQTRKRVCLDLSQLHAHKMPVPVSLSRGLGTAYCPTVMQVRVQCF